MRTIHGTRVALLALSVLASACTLPRWPVTGPITSPYGLRFRGIAPDLHPAVDIAAPAGTPVRAMTSGTVSFAGTLSGYGLTVIIEHGAAVQTLYAHLSAIDVQRGQPVHAQAVIGRVGQTGNATAPHLHFEVRRWNRPDDPVRLLGRRPQR